MYDYLADLFPIEDDMSDTMKKNRQKCKDDFMFCFISPDLEKFANTAWAAVNAAADFADHHEPVRKTASFRENNFARIIAGHTLVDSVMSKVC
jgi:hypothetical protein